MSRTTKLVAGLLLAATVSYGVLMQASPETRTRAYFGYISKLMLPESMFQPLTPVQWELEPHVVMQLDPYDLVSNRLLLYGAWEKNFWELMESHLPEAGVFVDVGAHIGFHSLKAAQRVGARGTVISVEPNPQTLVTLRSNVAASGALGVIKIQPIACSDKEATLEFFAAPRSNTGESSLSKRNASQEGTSTNTYQVRARPLDDVLEEAGIQRLDVLKIDVEGADLLVLKGAERTMNRFHPAIYVETVDSQLKEMGGSVAELVAFVVAHGYKSNTLAGGNTEFLPVR